MPRAANPTQSSEHALPRDRNRARTRCGSASSLVPRSSSASGRSWSRCRQTAGAIHATSSGVTKSRPASRAEALPAARRCTAARGLAPSEHARELARRERTSADDVADDRRRSRWWRRRARAAPRARRASSPAARRSSVAGTTPWCARRSIASFVGRRSDSRRRPWRGSGRAAPRAADRCPRTRSGSGSRRRGTDRGADARCRRRSPGAPASPRAARPASSAGCG